MTRCLREVVAELSGDEREGSEDDEVCAFAIADVHCADGHWHVLLQEAWLSFTGRPQNAKSAHVALKPLQHVLHAQYMAFIGLQRDCAFSPKSLALPH